MENERRTDFSCHLCSSYTIKQRCLCAASSSAARTACLGAGGAGGPSCSVTSPHASGASNMCGFKPTRSRFPIDLTGGGPWVETSAGVALDWGDVINCSCSSTVSVLALKCTTDRVGKIFLLVSSAEHELKDLVQEGFIAFLRTCDRCGYYWSSDLPWHKEVSEVRLIPR